MEAIETCNFGVKHEGWLNVVHTVRLNYRKKNKKANFKIHYDTDLLGRVQSRDRLDWLLLRAVLKYLKTP